MFSQHYIINKRKNSLCFLLFDTEHMMSEAGMQVNLDY